MAAGLSSRGDLLPTFVHAPELKSLANWVFAAFPMQTAGRRVSACTHRNRVDLACYGLALPSQSQTRTTTAEFLEVRHRLLSRCARLSRRPGCEGKDVHRGIHSRYWPLQPPVFGREQTHCPERSEPRQRAAAVGNGERPQTLCRFHVGRRGVLHYWSHDA